MLPCWDFWTVSGSECGKEEEEEGFFLLWKLTIKPSSVAWILCFANYSYTICVDFFIGRCHDVRAFSIRGEGWLAVTQESCGDLKLEIIYANCLTFMSTTRWGLEKKSWQKSVCRLILEANISCPCYLLVVIYMRYFFNKIHVYFCDKQKWYVCILYN